MKERAGQVAMIAVAVLILAAGFCVFDHDQDGTGDSGMSAHLCAGMLASSLGVVLLGAALVNGHLLIEPFRFSYAVSLHIPDPPPKSRSLL